MPHQRIPATLDHRCGSRVLCRTEWLLKILNLMRFNCGKCLIIFNENIFWTTFKLSCYFRILLQKCKNFQEVCCKNATNAKEGQFDFTWIIIRFFLVCFWQAVKTYRWGRHTLYPIPYTLLLHYFPSSLYFLIFLQRLVLSILRTSAVEEMELLCCSRTFLRNAFSKASFASWKVRSDCANCGLKLFELLVSKAA